MSSAASPPSRDSPPAGAPFELASSFDTPAGAGVAGALEPLPAQAHGARSLKEEGLAGADGVVVGAWPSADRDGAGAAAAGDSLSPGAPSAPSSFFVVLNDTGCCRIHRTLFPRACLAGPSRSSRDVPEGGLFAVSVMPGGLCPLTGQAPAGAARFELLAATPDWASASGARRGRGGASQGAWTGAGGASDFEISATR
jgi:hypothetical protein